MNFRNKISSKQPDNDKWLLTTSYRYIQDGADRRRLWAGLGTTPECACAAVSTCDVLVVLPLPVLEKNVTTDYISVKIIYI